MMSDGERGEPLKCPVCGGARERPDSCQRCGAVEGKQHECPHCGAIARSEPSERDAPYVRVCGACGGPRLSPDAMRAGGTKETLALLRTARLAQVRSAVLRGAAVTAGVIASILALLHVLLGFNGVDPRFMAVRTVLVLLPTLVAFVAFKRHRAQKAERDAALEKAFAIAVVRTLGEARAELTAKELAKRLGTSEAHAEQVLTELSVKERTSIEIGEDAELRYRVPDVDREEEEEEREPLSPGRNHETR